MLLYAVANADGAACLTWETCVLLDALDKTSLFIWAWG